MICQDSKNRCFATKPVKGGLSGVSPSSSPCPDGTSAVGDYHTHGNYSDRAGKPTTAALDEFDSLNFSPGDKSGITQDAQGRPGYKGYLGTPGNTYKVFDPSTGNVSNL